MDLISNKVAYLKGLAEGFGYTIDDNNQKVILGIIDCLGLVADEIDMLNEDFHNLENYVELVDEDLAEFESMLDDEDYDYDDWGDVDWDSDFDDDYDFEEIDEDEVEDEDE
ncbi:MAG: hypothetical protein SOZ40_02065 [Ezakiella sp.]|nr:hypothetical protein [Bacillota bacterium]MDY3946775.1 hypothetical protein [Ezakiella sp.]